MWAWRLSLTRRTCSLCSGGTVDRRPRFDFFTAGGSDGLLSLGLPDALEGTWDILSESNKSNGFHNSVPIWSVAKPIWNSAFLFNAALKHPPISNRRPFAAHQVHTDQSLVSHVYATLPHSQLLHLLDDPYPVWPTGKARVLLGWEGETMQGQRAFEGGEITSVTEIEVHWFGSDKVQMRLSICLFGWPVEHNE